MNVQVRSTFERDIRKLKDKATKRKIREVIQQIQAADKLSDLPQVKKLSGHPHAYRVRVGNFRIGFYYTNNIVVLARVKDRKDLYTYFPE